MARRKEVAPVVSNAKGEIHSEDFPIQQPSPIILPETGIIEQRQAEPIVAVEGGLDKDYANALSFMEEELKIIIEPSSEENAPMQVHVGVNGDNRWVPVGIEIPIKRKFVEVLLRSKPISVSTEHESRDSGAKVINNQIRRSIRAKYPLSITYDPSGSKGVEWMRRTRMEAA